MFLPLGQNFNACEYFFIVVNDQRLKNNVSFWSHCWHDLFGEKYYFEHKKAKGVWAGGGYRIIKLK